MILVSNKPIDSLPENDLRRVWYNKEIAKIKQKEAVIIKKIVSYRLDAQGKRHKPPIQGIQSKQMFVSEMGEEIWACCQSYQENADKTYKFTPNYYYIENLITLNPKTQFELIFYFTCIVNLAKYGCTIDNPEEEAREISDKELPELDVKYAIYKHNDREELNFVAQTWGITNAKDMGENQLKQKLFEVVKKSEANKINTKRGYKEFIDEVLKSNPEVAEARAVVNMAISKGIITVDPTRCKYAETGDTIVMIPIDERGRVNDFIAETLLKTRNQEIYETIRLDVSGTVSVEKPSIADIEGMKTRDALKRAAKKLNVIVAPTWKDETIRTKLITAIQGEPVTSSKKEEE